MNFITITINLVLSTLLFAPFLLNSHILIVVGIGDPPTVMIVIVTDVNSVMLQFYAKSLFDLLSQVDNVLDVS